MARHDWTASSPGLIRSLRPDGEGLVSWRICDWHRFSLADVAPLGRDPALLSDLNLWRSLQSSACPLLEQQSVPTPPAERFILLLDQEAGPARDMLSMLETVLSQHPGLPVWVLPDEGARRAGLLARTLARSPHPNVHVLLPGTAAWPWLQAASSVCTHSAERGFTALMAGAALTTWGQPWYAGWGLTEDALPAPPERGQVTLPALFEAVAWRGSMYADLAHRGQGCLRDTLEFLAVQKSVRDRFRDLGTIEAYGMAAWKKAYLRPYLSAGGHPMRWRTRLDACTPAKKVTTALWGATPRPSACGGAVVRVEDGFLRSAGLGSDLVPPSSLVIDREGIYFNAVHGSELLTRLSRTQVEPEARARAAALRRMLVELRVTKYNFAPRPVQWKAPPHRKVVLAIGQVADDAAMILGAGRSDDAVTTAEQMLARVRAEQPAAWLVFKPHPDVLSGNRRGLIAAHELCDEVDTEADLLSLFDAVDEVHVVSSLAGFDALIRGKPVVTHGLPFYAGWGLTTDRCEHLLDRPKKLQLDDLIAVTLLDYPIYWDWHWLVFSTPEAVARHLADCRQNSHLPGPGQLIKRTLNKSRRWLRNILSGWV